MAQHPLKDGLHPSTVTTGFTIPDLAVTQPHSNSRPHPPGVKPGPDYRPDTSHAGTTLDPFHDIPENILKSLIQVAGDNSSRIDLDIPHLRPVFSDGGGVLSVCITLFV